MLMAVQNLSSEWMSVVSLLFYRNCCFTAVCLRARKSREKKNNDDDDDGHAFQCIHCCGVYNSMSIAERKKENKEEHFFDVNTQRHWQRHWICVLYGLQILDAYAVASNTFLPILFEIGRGGLVLCLKLYRTRFNSSMCVCTRVFVCVFCLTCKHDSIAHSLCSNYWYQSNPSFICSTIVNSLQYRILTILPCPTR